MPDSPVIRVAELSKVFRVPEREAGLRAATKSLVRRRTREVRAVEAISFEIAPGEIVGFLGPNGGSSTTQGLCRVISPPAVPDRRLTGVLLGRGSKHHY